MKMKRRLLFSQTDQSWAECFKIQTCPVAEKKTPEEFQPTPVKPNVRLCISGISTRMIDSIAGDLSQWAGMDTRTGIVKR